MSSCYDDEYTMVILKKLTFAPIFLIVFGLFIYQLNPLFKSYDLIFSLSLNTLIQFIMLICLILLASFLFILFACLAQDWKLVLPVGIITAIIPLGLVPQPLSIILAIGTLISILLIFLTLENKLKNYLTFEPNSLLGPSIRHLAGLLVLVIALAFFLSVNKIVQQKGFEIPDSIIDTALKFTSTPESGQEEQTQTTLPQLKQEQMNKFLPSEVDLLKQAGLDPKILDSLNQPTGKTSKTIPSSQDVLKQTVKGQLNNIMKPYLGAIPTILSVMLFLTLVSLVSFLGILIYPLLWVIFYILEKSGFIKFTVEQRTVRKMLI